MSETWDHNGTEQSRAFEAFTFYRDLGAQRSLDRAYAAYREAHGLPALPIPSGYKNAQAPRMWNTWSSQNDWPSRSLAYDVYLEMQSRRERETEHADELRAYRESAKVEALALRALAVTSRTKLAARIERLIDQVEPASVPSMLRAIAAIEDCSLNAWAESIGVRELERVLDEKDRKS